MDTTRPSLLIRVKDPTDTQAWTEFHDLYGPLLYRYARERGLGHDDAEEIRSSCYETIVHHIRSFEYDRQKAGFRAWLRRLVVNRVIDSLRKKRELSADHRNMEQVPSDALAPDEIWDENWKLHHLRYCLMQIRDRVSAQTFEAFRLLVDEERSVDEVCGRLNVNANQVYKAKARVLRLVRQCMDDLYPDDEG